jgi:5-methylcytosine-specific restriction protein A
MRREFTKQVKLAAWQRAGGRCEKCTCKLFSGNIRYDHVVPDAMGGDPTIENCEVLCRTCHDAKTYVEDIPRISKSKRQRDHHVNARTRKANSRPIPGSKDSGWKKKMDGTIVRRD